MIDPTRSLRRSVAVLLAGVCGALAGGAALLAIDPASFPLGTGPKAHEIWHEGYYPVVWTNRGYRMAYVNMGHDDLGDDGRPVSSSFASATQNRLIRQLLYWVAGRDVPAG